MKILEPLMHIIAWGMFFGFPFFFLLNSEGGTMDWGKFLHHSIVPVALSIVFYTNYFLLIPHCLFKGKDKSYFLINAALVVFISLNMQIWQVYMSPGRPEHGFIGFRINPGLIFYTRDVFSLMLAIGMAAAIRLSKRWSEAESARKEAERRSIEAERSKTEAELKNLRNQLNPHFLLNTLNNIYALIEFDKEKAQSAVSELSRLLRYVLYENQQDTVPLYKEADFIRNYIALMKIRLTSNVKVDTDIDISPDSRTEIAPMLFISLIENAFKHGISPAGTSFIRISLRETPDEICCDITNSYHPKKENDKSGSGIGLEQVSKRLELLYHGRYRWIRKADETAGTYRSFLTIYIREIPVKQK